MEAESNWNKSFIELGVKYAELFQLLGEDFFFQMAKFESVLNCVISLYYVLVSEDSLVRIEDLPAARKQWLFDEAKRISVNQSRLHIIRVSKAIHCFGTIVNI